MRKTIRIDDETYELPASLKQGPRDSFTQVILRHVVPLSGTNTELREAAEETDPPVVDVGLPKRIRKERGRRPASANDCDGSMGKMAIGSPIEAVLRQAGEFSSVATADLLWKSSLCTSFTDSLFY